MCSTLYCPINDTLSSPLLLSPNGIKLNMATIITVTSTRTFILGEKLQYILTSWPPRSSLHDQHSTRKWSFYNEIKNKFGLCALSDVTSGHVTQIVAWCWNKKSMFFLIWIFMITENSDRYWAIPIETQRNVFYKSWLKKSWLNQSTFIAKIESEAIKTRQVPILEPPNATRPHAGILKIDGGEI